MRNYVISEKYRQDNATGSKGAQKKYYRNGYWYKLDGRTLESANEHLVSLILASSNISDYVYYEVCTINSIRGCRSKSFIDETKEIFYTADYIIQSLYSINNAQDYVWKVSSSISDRFSFLVNALNVFTKNSIDNSDYIKTLLYLDLFICNRDRHFGNFGLIFDYRTRKYRPAPNFDNGLSCLCNDLLVYNECNKDIEFMVNQQTAKTISGSFVAQIQAVSSIGTYKSPFKIDFQKLESLIKNDLYVTNLQKEFLAYQYKQLKNIYI